jgi:ferredoxin
MKVVVDRELCQGHGQCEHSAPEVFEVGDDGLAYVLRDPDGSELLEKTRDASFRCPVDAIAFVDE